MDTWFTARILRLQEFLEAANELERMAVSNGEAQTPDGPAVCHSADQAA